MILLWNRYVGGSGSWWGAGVREIEYGRDESCLAVLTMAEDRVGTVAQILLAPVSSGGGKGMRKEGEGEGEGEGEREGEEHLSILQRIR